MKNRFEQKKDLTKINLAAAGVLSALIFVILLIASVTPVSKLAIAALASFIMEFVFCEYGKKTALMSFIVVSIISVLTLPQKSIGILFITVFGGYVTIRNLLGLKNKVILLVIKLLYLNVAVYLLFTLASFVFGDLAEKVMSFPQWQIIAGIFVLQLVFVAYDYVLTLGGRILGEYYRKLRR